MGRISAVRAQVFPPDQLRYGGYLRLVKLVPEDPWGALQTARWCDPDDLLGRDNDVQPEVVRGLGQVLVQDLEAWTVVATVVQSPITPASRARANSRSEYPPPLPIRTPWPFTA